MSLNLPVLPCHSSTQLLLDEPDDAVVVPTAAVDHAELAALTVVVGEEGVADEFHLKQRLVDGHRVRGVEFLPNDQRAVAFHLDRHQARGVLLGLVGVRVVIPAAVWHIRKRDQGLRPPRVHPARAPAATAAGGGYARRPGGEAATADGASTDRTDASARRGLRRSDARRSRASTLANARSSATYRSSAAASARIVGPLDLIVSSTRSLRSDCLGLRSFDTSTSIRIA